MGQPSSYVMHFIAIFIGLLIFYFVPVTIAYYLLYVRNKEKFRQYKIQAKYPTDQQIRREIKYSIQSLFIFSIAGLFIYEAAIINKTAMYFKIADYGTTYFILSLFIVIIVNDTLFYWTHRFMHLKRVFRHFHVVHHKSTAPTPFAVFSFGAGEAILHSIVYTSMVFFIPLHVVLFIVFHLYNMVENIGGHAGFEFLSLKQKENWFFNWQNTVTNHDLHHKYFNCNYGNYFIWWDRIMNTLSEKNKLHKVEHYPLQGETKVKELFINSHS